MDEESIGGFEYAAFRYASGLGRKTINELKSCGVFESYKDLVGDKLQELKNNYRSLNLSDSSMGELEAAFKKEDTIKRTVDDYLNRACLSDIYTVCEDDPDYPYNWKFLNGMPKVFFAKGRRQILRKLFSNGSVAVVGSRNPGRYSLFATEDFTRQIAEKDVAVISGLALGVDRQAHMTTLDMGKDTIAVTGGGPDVIYPYQNKDLYERISEDGLIISELPPGEKVLRQYFPSRNRLIAGLCDACLIMEAGLHSGTLHTASFAAAYGRDVFVLPNNIYADNVSGGLYLIRDGAEILIEPQAVIGRVKSAIVNRYLMEGCDHKEVEADNIEMLRRKLQGRSEELTRDEWELLIMDELSLKSRSADELISALGIKYVDLCECLSALELKRKISVAKGKYFLTFESC